MGRGIPLPGIFWLAPDGRINAKFARAGYRTRPPLKAVRDAVSTAPAPGLWLRDSGLLKWTGCRP